MFHRKGLPAGSLPGYHVTENDRIRLTVENTLASQALLVQVRVLAMSGGVVLISRRFVPTTDGLPSEVTITLLDGLLISVTVVTDGVTTTSDTTFVRAGLQHGAVYSNILWLIFFANFIRSRSGLSWSSGSPSAGESLSLLDPVLTASPFTVVRVTVPGVVDGSPWIITVPSGEVWDLEFASLVTTNDGAAGNRRLKVWIGAGTNDAHSRYSIGTSPASTSARWHLHRDIDQGTYSLSGEIDFAESNLPHRRIIGGEEVRIETVGPGTLDRISQRAYNYLRHFPV